MDWRDSFLFVQRSELFHEYKFNLIQKTYRFLFRSYVLLTFFDPYLIYKKNFQNDGKAKIHLREKKNQVGEDQWSKIRSKIRPFQIIVQVYLIVKNFAVVILHLSSNRGYIEKSNHRSTILSTDNKYNAGFSELLIYIIGDPMSDLTPITVILYSVNIVALLYSVVLMSYYFEKNPIDLFFLRNFCNPKLEVTRIDKETRYHLAHLLSAIDRNKYQLVNNQKLYFKQFRPINKTIVGNEKHNELPTYKATLYKWNLLKNQSDLISSKQAQVWRMRPALYEEHWYRRMNREIPFVVVSISLAIGILFLFITSSLNNLLLARKCQLKRLQGLNCNFRVAFTPFEILSLIDRILAGAFNYLFVTTISIFILNNIFSQLLLAKDLKTDLKSLLSLLSGQNLKHPDFMKHHAECHLLETLITLTASVTDFRKISKSTAQLLEAHLTIVSCAFTVMIVTSTYLNLFGMVRQCVQLIVPLWLLSNIIMIACAYTFARLVELEQIVWSIFAQISIRNRLDGHIQDYYNDHLGIAWQRFVFGYTLSMPINSVRPFGISITNQKVLKLNFLVLSAVAFMRTFKY